MYKRQTLSADKEWVKVPILMHTCRDNGQCWFQVQLADVFSSVLTGKQTVFDLLAFVLIITLIQHFTFNSVYN